VFKIPSLCVEPLQTSLHLSSAVLPLQTVLPYCGVSLTESFHKFELQAPLLPQYSSSSIGTATLVGFGLVNYR